MNMVKITYENGLYDSGNATSFKMDVLGQFLARDVGYCYRERIPFRDWALADKDDQNSGFTCTNGGDTAFLEEEEDGFIYIYDGTVRFDEMSKSNSAKMSRQQFVQLLDDWHEKVYKPKPKEVIIKHENDQFIIETKN